MSRGRATAAAWRAFQESPDFPAMLNPATLGTDHPEEYLRNRLWHAFMAGAGAMETIMETEARQADAIPVIQEPRT